ncbi:MAG: hypothetical protein ACLRYY_13000 [Anaerobutyricum soehngenii]
MDGRKIFDAINTCDDVFIKEVVLDMENRRKKQDRFKRLFFNKNQHLSGIRIAAAIVLFIVILGVEKTIRMLPCFFVIGWKTFFRNVMLRRLFQIVKQKHIGGFQIMIFKHALRQNVLFMNSLFV